jgi:hypothetical protein
LGILQLLRARAGIYLGKPVGEPMADNCHTVSNDDAGGHEAIYVRHVRRRTS